MLFLPLSDMIETGQQVQKCIRDGLQYMSGEICREEKEFWALQ